MELSLSPKIIIHIPLPFSLWLQRPSLFLSLTKSCFSQVKPMLWWSLGLTTCFMVYQVQVNDPVDVLGVKPQLQFRILFACCFAKFKSIQVRPSFKPRV